MPPLSRAFALRLVAVFLLALAVRAIHVSAIGKAPFARLLVGDARSYTTWAGTIAGGDWLGKETFYQAPLYPYALAVLEAAAGSDPMTVRWAQAVVGALSCVLLAVAGLFWFSERAGAVAGALAAVYPPAIYFDGLIQKASLDNLFMCALLAILGAYAGSGRPRLLLGAGAILGLFALTRENALVFFVLLAAWLPFHLAARSWRQRAAAVALLTAGTALVLVPVGLRNEAVGGEFLITTSQAGSNFFIGNGENANGRYVPIRAGREMPEFERTDATEVAEQALGRALRPSEVSAYWWSRALAWMRAHPGQALVLDGTKILLTWNRTELPDTEAFEVYQDYSLLLRGAALVLGFGTLATLGAAGMVLAWRATPRPSLLYLMLFGFSAAVAAFYVFARYRFPMVPMLALFSSYALVRAFDGFRAGSRRPPPTVLGAAVVAAAVAVLPIVPGRGSRGLAYENLGIGFSEAGDTGEAVRFFRKAIELEPGEPGPHYNLAVVLTRLDRVEEAATELETTLRLDARNAAAHDNLGALLAERGDFVDAERHFREAYRIDPTSPETMMNLGNAALGQGRAEEAVDWYRRSLAVKPGDVGARLDLVQALERLGRREEAAREARAVLGVDPGNREAGEALHRLESGGRNPV